MQLFDAIRARASYRGAFSSTPVPLDHLLTIAEAACLAPSGCNRQTPRFILVDNPVFIREISAIIVKEKVAGAGAVLVFCMEKGQEYAVEDCAAAVENALLALTAYGYVSCWIDGALRSGERAGRMAALLGVPDAYAVRVILPVGHPAEDPKPPEKMPFEERVFYNRFGDSAKAPEGLL
ncbi:MAG: nitroreductase family protein [Fibrobacterota bacterium]